ncbi:MAG: UvrB/UvrC motif-containing protein [Ruminococcus sp.]
MKCQKCKVKNATTQVKRIINGEYEEYMLCADCAHEMGFSNVFDMDMPDMFGGLMKSLFSTALPARSGASRCDVCSSTYGDITNTGKVGCSKCYEVFLDELLPSIKRIHGNTTHCGKTPRFSPAKAKANANEVKEPTVDELKAQLKEAIEVQNFELAAELRDKIKEMEA